MYKLKLVKGLSYSGNGVNADNAHPYVEVDSKEISASLVASGYFELMEKSEPVETENKAIDKMTAKELIAYADENGIDIQGLTKKADILARIEESL